MRSTSHPLGGLILPLICKRICIPTKRRSQMPKNQGQMVQMPAKQLSLLLSKATGKNGNSSRKRAQGQKRHALRSLNQSIGLSMCAQKYALAIVRPFDASATGVCIPTFPALPSQKVRRFIRGTFTIGTAGVGFVAVAPCMSNDAGCFYSTTSSYSGTGFQVRTSGTTNPTGVALGILPGPYSSDQFAASTTTSATTVLSSVRGRLVSAGLTAQYAGPLLNRGGVVTALSQPTHDTIAGLNPVTPADLGAYIETYQAPDHGQKVLISATGVYPEELEYQSEELTNGVTPRLWPFTRTAAADLGPTDMPDPNMIIAITGGAIGAVYQFELVLHCEYIGRPTAGVVTPSEADVLGFQAVNTASRELPVEMSAVEPESYYDALPGVMNNLTRRALNAAKIITSGNNLIGASAVLYGAARMRGMNNNLTVRH